MKFVTLNQFAPCTEEFSFIRMTNPLIKDAIVICNPPESICISPVFIRSKKTLPEHIDYINNNNIKKAFVVAEDIAFIRECPGLEYLRVIPSLTAEEFDFTPLYDLPNIKWLQCDTMYGLDERKVAHIDYGKFQNLQNLVVDGAHGHHQVDKIKGLKELYLGKGQPMTGSLEEAFDGCMLEKLGICQSPIRSLDGLENARQLCKLELAYNTRLEDISALSRVKETLVSLEIENCGKIKDFSVLSELRNLEELRMVGSNKLPNLNFIYDMQKLKSFIFMMNTENGDLSMCERIPYVAIKNRKHYSHKDKDFCKKKT